MPDTPEVRARQNIDQLLTDASWIVQSREDANLNAGRGVAIREFPIHFTGSRRGKALVPVDCSALTPTLGESELFGHVNPAHHEPRGH
jgi:transcriptional regulator with GAF, ATPase, and Fis domain